MKWDDIKDKPREIDWYVGQHVMGLQHDRIMLRSGQEMVDYPDEHFSTNIYDAWEVIEKLQEWRPVIRRHPRLGYIITLEGLRPVTSKIAPIAICEAALLAKGVIE